MTLKIFSRCVNLHQDFRKFNPSQCAIPVFECLLPSAANTIIMELLFIFCTWHALAKLRLHTTSTLKSLDQATRSLGKILRQFSKKICQSYATRELPREKGARLRREAKKAAQKKASAAKSKPNTDSPKDAKFSLFTFKLHHLGHYSQDIKNFGTTDNYSTQVVSKFRS